MIKQIRGTVAGIDKQLVIVDVGGVGYGVHTPHNTSQFLLDEPVCFHTHLAVRENALDLYGFADQESLRVFELLIELPKIGPKSALQILVQADAALLQGAVLSQDPSHLSKMSGITKKSAEKIVLGLKDAFDAAGYSYGNDYSPGTPEQAIFASDTIDALITLGYPQADARKAVQQLIIEQPQITKVNDAIKAVLKILG